MEKITIGLIVVLVVLIIFYVIKLDNLSKSNNIYINYLKEDLSYYKKLSELLQKQTVLYKDIGNMNDEIISNQKQEIILLKQMTK